MTHLLKPATHEEAQLLRSRCKSVMDTARGMWDLQGLLVHLKLDLRGRAAGTARLIRKESKGIIRLNLEAYRLAPAEMLDDTIPHEIAHLVAGWTGLGKGHDMGWRRIAIALGSTGQRCHELDLTPARRTAQHRYIATCGTAVDLGPARHKKIQSGAVYTVRRTGGRIARTGYQGVPG